jgi:hypothetical protein
MLARAVYLRDAMDAFCESEGFDYYKLTKKEWSQAEFLLELLMPFKRCSQRLQETHRPSIDKVFWVYETLYNELDQFSEVLNQPAHKNYPWAQEIKPALNALHKKLTKYYSRTGKPFVYTDGVIFQPRGKLALFKQASWDTGDAEKYSRECRDRYVSNYEHCDIENNSTNALGSSKRSYAKSSMSEDDEYEQMLRSLNSNTVQNEYDRYASTPRETADIETLSWWRVFGEPFPHLRLQVRNTLAVPPTGAGVERQFSKSGKVATPTRWSISANRITQVMMLKDSLERRKRPIKMMDGAGLGVGYVITDGDDNLPPKEWRDKWWESRVKGSEVPTRKKARM